MDCIKCKAIYGRKTPCHKCNINYNRWQIAGIILAEIGLLITMIGITKIIIDRS